LVLLLTPVVAATDDSGDGLARSVGAATLLASPGSFEGTFSGAAKSVTAAANATPAHRMVVLISFMIPSEETREFL
jgi:hypothetical protein